MFKHAPVPLLLLLTVLMSGCVMMPTRVAIMDFENATGDPAFDKLKIAVPEYLTQYLTNYGFITLLERQDIHRFLAEIDSDPTDTRNLSRWQKLGEKINAHYLIAGSCSRLDQNFVLCARIFSVEKGQVIPRSASTKTCMREYEIFDQVRSIASELGYQLKYRGGAVARQSAQQGVPSREGAARLPAASERTPVPYVQQIR